MILARHLSASVTATELTFYQICYGTLFLLPVFLIHEYPIEWKSVNRVSVLVLLFLVLGATIVGFLAYNYAISKIHVSRAAVFLNGIPLVSVAVSAILLGERLGLNQLVGGLVVIAGVTLTNLHHRPPAVPTPIVSLAWWSKPAHGVLFFLQNSHRFQAVWKNYTKSNICHVEI
jgi:drug/metabolite transporter (DMT)-like permease